MTKPKPPFADELQQKHREGNFKPSDFKRNRGWSLPTKIDQSTSSENIELATLQAELNNLREKFNHSQQELTNFTQTLTKLFPNEQLSLNELLNKLIAEKNALELALFDKRLESLKEFSDYRERIKHLESTELSELANLRSKLAKHSFTLSLDTSAKLVLLTLALALLLK